jgi:hypothetical protein
MRRPDDGLGDPRIVASLEAVDATLAGDPVDPIHAELAELALLLADERPTTPPAFAARLDRAVERRFVPVASAKAKAAPGVVPALRRRWWFWTPAAGLAAALIAAVVIVAAGGSQGPAFSSSSSNAALPSPSAGHNAAQTPLVAAAPSSSQRTPSSASGAAASSASTASGAPASAANGASGTAVPLAPPANGRKVIQGAQLALSTSPTRLDEVAQEVFVVVGQVQGIVNSSTVTATSGPGGYAQFQLSIPSGSLPRAMASLSSLRYAEVTSRTDTTQDVNDQYQADVRALADARALRTSLLKQLANATTQAQIDSLTARIHDAEASISSDEATLRGLNHQINYSQVGLTINGGPVPVIAQSGSGGFGIGRAAHDAGRVLTVAAGIALIGVAALLPIALLGALAWWVATMLRRRRREQALDLV